MDGGLRSELSKQGIFITTLEKLYNWGRKNSAWPLQFGLAQMPEPKYVIAMGACAISGGPFKQGYNELKGLPLEPGLPGFGLELNVVPVGSISWKSSDFSHERRATTPETLLPPHTAPGFGAVHDARFGNLPSCNLHESLLKEQGHADR